MKLRKLINAMEPESRIHLLGKDGETLARTCAGNVFVIREHFKDKKILSIVPSYLLHGDKIKGCLIIKIDYNTPLKST